MCPCDKKKEVVNNILKMSEQDVDNTIGEVTVITVQEYK